MHEREVVLEEIAMYEDDPQDRVFDVIGEAVFGGHPLGRAILGRADVVSAADRRAPAFHAARYTPGNVVIAAAGSVDHDQVVGWAREAARRSWARIAPRPPAPPERACDPLALPGQGDRAVPRLPRGTGARPG